MSSTGSGLLPLELGLQHPELSEQVSSVVAEAVWARDRYSCRFCGFFAARFQRVAVIGENWRDLESLATACIFCADCRTLQGAETKRSAAVTVFPEMEQHRLNRLLVEVYLARISGRRGRRANAFLSRLNQARKEAEKLYGTSDPGRLARGLKRGESNPVEKLHELQGKGLRCFCLDRRILREGRIEFNQFPQILTFWRSPSGPYPQGQEGPLPLFDQLPHPPSSDRGGDSEG